MAEFETLTACLVDINNTLQAEDPQRIASALLGKNLINPSDYQKICLEGNTEMRRAMIISHAVLFKVKAKPEVCFPAFLSILEQYKLDKLVGILTEKYGECNVYIVEEIEKD